MSDLSSPAGAEADGARPAVARDRSWQARWIGWLAVAYAALIPTLAYGGNMGFAVAAALGGLLCLPVVARPSEPVRGLWLLIALVAWSLVTYAWSPAAPGPAEFSRYKTIEHVTGLKLVLQLALYASFALGMRATPPAAARRAMSLMAVLLTTMTALLLVEAATSGWVYSAIKAAVRQPTTPDLAARNVSRACHTLCLLLWPVVAVAYQGRHRALAFVLVPGALAAAVAFKVDAPIVALILSGLVFALVARFGPRALWLCVAGVAVYLVLTPVVVSLASGAGLMHDTPGHIGKASWFARLQIWNAADQLVLARPLRGWGLDASRSWPQLIPLHPHNAALQLWLELGPIGAGLAALFFAWLFSRIAEQAEKDRIAAAASAGAAIAYLIIGALSFGVWQEWWLGLGAITVAVCSWSATARRSAPAISRDALVPL